MCHIVSPVNLEYTSFKGPPIMATLAEIRAKLLAQDTKQSGKSGGGDNAIYPFWNMDEGSTTSIRFLPDADTSNTYFWRERQMIRIPFSGIKDADESKPIVVQVPCAEMWQGLRCPIHDEIRPWFKDPSMEDMARKYWKKRSYLFQGLVTDSTLKEDNTPENPVRRFMINTSIFNIIKAALMDPDFPEIPTDYDQGTDFKLVKTQKGQYADYSTSNWARRERSLTEQEREAVATHSLFDLNDFMPKQPGDKELSIISEMFEASVNGETYDPEKFADFYRPAGMQYDTNNSSTVPVTPKAETPKDEEVKEQTDSVTSDTSEQPAGQQSASDILAKLRSRKTAD